MFSHIVSRFMCEFGIAAYHLDYREDWQVICWWIDWKLGPIEIVSLVVFLGYCITFCIHITYAYTEARIFMALAFKLSHQMNLLRLRSSQLI